MNQLQQESRTEQINSLIRQLKHLGGSAKDISDGYHTYDDLYTQRMVLTASLFKKHQDVAWKSWYHHDGTMFDGSFIVGVQTPKGQYSYHYHAEFWDLFDVPSVDFAPEYDGHTSNDVYRLLDL